MFRALAFAVMMLGLSSPSPAQTFVDPQHDGLLAVIPPPPDDSTPAGRADLQTVLLVQSMRTPEDERQAAEDAGLAPAEWAQRGLGSDYTLERYPEAFALFEAVRADMTGLVDALKARGHQRARPHRRDSRVRPSLPAEGQGSNSWPAGRAAATRVWAGVLSDLFPERAEALMEAARRSGELRLVAGVHFPTDIAAGHVLADAFLARLRGQPDYRREVSRIRSQKQSEPG